MVYDLDVKIINVLENGGGLIKVNKKKDIIIKPNEPLVLENGGGLIKVI